MANHRLVAVVGMPFSGKSGVVTYLEENGYSKVYFGDITLKVLDDRGLPHTEENEREVREALRRDEGMDAYARRNLPAIQSLLHEGKKVVIDGLYSWEERELLKKEFPDMFVLAVWAPPELRYERAANRPDRDLTREQAISRDQAQLVNLHTGGPIANADGMLPNIGTPTDLANALYLWRTGDLRAFEEMPVRVFR